MAFVTPPEPDWTRRPFEDSTNALDAFDSEVPELNVARVGATEIPEPNIARARTTEIPEPNTPRAGTTSEVGDLDALRLATTAPPEQPHVSLAALKAAGIRFEGDEAIALGQALCRELMTAQTRVRLDSGSDVTSLSLPVDLDAIFVDATGRVSATVNDPRDEPAAIRCVGKMLSDILPLRARLVLEPRIISKALASPPEFRTLDELSQALAVYERPDGRELIEAVYERGKERGVPAATLTSSIVPPPLPETTPDPPPAAVRSGYRPLTVAGVVVLAVAITGITEWFLISRSHDEPPTVTVQVAPSPSEEHVASATSAEVTESTPSQVGEPASLPRPTVQPVTRAAPPLAQTSGNTRSVTVEAARSPQKLQTASATAAKVAKPTPSAPAVLNLPVVQLTRQTPSATSPIFAGGAGAVAPSVSRPDAAKIRSSDGIAIPINPLAPTSDNAASARSTAVSGPRPRSAALPPIYDASDADVSPPMPVLPRLLASLEPSSPGVRLDALTIAVVVNPDGTVDSVKWMNAPQNMSELVLLTGALSVVKSWHFSPATRGGVAVRYRQIVPLRDLTRLAP